MKKYKQWNKKELKEALIKTLDQYVANDEKIVIGKQLDKRLKERTGHCILNTIRRRGLIKIVYQYQKKYNFKKTDKHCSRRGCRNLATHFTKNSKGRNGLLAYCEVHKVHRQNLHKNYLNLVKEEAKINASNYYLENIKKIKTLKLLNKRLVLQKIDQFYKEDALLEPKFCILLHDICRLQGGDPIREYPYWTKKHKHYLLPNFADLIDRKFFLAIEVKASFCDTPAQHKLEAQKIEYKFFFKNYTVLGVSPDEQAGTIGLYKFLELLIKRRKKVYGK